MGGSASEEEYHGLEPAGLRVTIVGSGNFGSAVAAIVSHNCAHRKLFDSQVRMWVYEETYRGRLLTEIINSEHTNPKYLPDVYFPLGLRAESDLLKAVEDADVLVFVVPHQFIKLVLEKMVSRKTYAQSAIGISLIKGFEHDKNKPCLYSQTISDALDIPCCVLSGANVAQGSANPCDYSETTIGYRNYDHALIWRELFDRPSFKVSCVPDIAGVEICGALKNVVAMGVGFASALNCGSNTTASLIRIGFAELRSFATLFYTNIMEETFFESAGIADIITTCLEGRNAKCAKIFAANDGKLSWEDIERDYLGNQKLQGPTTSKMVNELVEQRQLQSLFPYFQLIYRVSAHQVKPKKFIEMLQTPDFLPIKRLVDCSAANVPRTLKPLKTRMITADNILT